MEKQRHFMEIHIQNIIFTGVATVYYLNHDSSIKVC